MLDPVLGSPPRARQFQRLMTSLHRRDLRAAELTGALRRHWDTHCQNHGGTGVPSGRDAGTGSVTGGGPGGLPRPRRRPVGRTR